MDAQYEREPAGAAGTADDRRRSPRKLLHDNWSFRRAGDDRWLSAGVPGCNFTDLLRNGRIEDPFYRDNERSLQWIEQEDWEYLCEFELTEAELEADVDLVFEGLDTYAAVTLNGQRILDADNMFRVHRLACREHLEAGRNELVIVFRSPIREALPRHEESGFTYPAENDDSNERLSVYTRKAPYHYGWDWGPRFVTSGIWRPVYLEFIQCARIAGLHCVIRELTDQKAELSITVDVDVRRPLTGMLSIDCPDVVGIRQAAPVEMPAGSYSHRVDVTIPEPRRWWPNGLGEAYLYDFEISIAANGGILDRRRQRVGLRTIELVNTADEHGECFYLKVNGRPVFMKGANYIPSDSFLDRVSVEKYRRVFADAVAANMNMLRVWGGGVYERDVFYELADEHGVLIWQDFMFACSLYPGDPDFLGSVAAEATDTIRRLRNHPCLALWCGNNEIEMGMECWDWPRKFNYSPALYSSLQDDYGRLFRDLLPRLVAEYDGERFYLPSSPIGFWERPEDDRRGDNHYWGIWHGGEDFEEYRRRVPRFMSEFGFQSFPLLESVKRYSEPTDWDISSEVMTVHQRHPRGSRVIRDYMGKSFREPDSFEHFLYLSQVQQAEGLRIAFEAHRGAMPYCMGSLYWQFNDCWPAASWSGIDYYGRWKALHYQARRSFAPTIVFTVPNGDDIEIRIASDTADTRSAELDIRLLNLDGELLARQSCDVRIPANTAATVWRTPQSVLLAGHDPRELVLVASLLNCDTRIGDSLYYFVPPRRLALRAPSVECGVEACPRGSLLRLRADTLVKHLYVSIDGLPADVNLSDNFFDLLPGQEKRLYVPTDKQVMDLDIGLLSVFDTFHDPVT